MVDPGALMAGSSSAEAECPGSLADEPQDIGGPLGIRNASDVAKVADEDEAVNAQVLVTADQVAVYGLRRRDADLDAPQVRGSVKVS